MGTAIANELAGPGFEIIVLERAIPGAEASTAAAGMLAPQLEAQARGVIAALPPAVACAPGAEAEPGSVRHIYVWHHICRGGKGNKQQKCRWFFC